MENLYDSVLGFSYCDKEKSRTMSGTGQDWTAARSECAKVATTKKESYVGCCFWIYGSDSLDSESLRVQSKGSP